MAGLSVLEQDAPPALVAWGYRYGARKGDVVQLSINGPEGKAIFTHDALMEKALGGFSAQQASGPMV